MAQQGSSFIEGTINSMHAWTNRLSSLESEKTVRNPDHPEMFDQYLIGICEDPLSEKIRKNHYKIVKLDFEKEEVCHLFPFPGGKHFFYLSYPKKESFNLEKGLTTTEPLSLVQKEEFQKFTASMGTNQENLSLKVFDHIPHRGCFQKKVYSQPNESLVLVGNSQNIKFKHTFTDEASVYCYHRSESFISVYREGHYLELKPGLGKILSVVPLKGLYLAVLVQQGTIHFINKTDGKWVKTLNHFTEIPAMGVSASGEQLILMKGWHFSQAYVLDYTDQFPGQNFKKQSYRLIFNQCTAYHQKGVDLLKRRSFEQLKAIQLKEVLSIAMILFTVYAMAILSSKIGQTRE